MPSKHYTKQLDIHARTATWSSRKFNYFLLVQILRIWYQFFNTKYNMWQHSNYCLTYATIHTHIQWNIGVGNEIKVWVYRLQVKRERECVCVWARGHGSCDDDNGPRPGGAAHGVTQQHTHTHIYTNRYAYRTRERHSKSEKTSHNAWIPKHIRTLYQSVIVNWRKRLIRPECQSLGTDLKTNGNLILNTQEEQCYVCIIVAVLECWEL